MSPLRSLHSPNSSVCEGSLLAGCWSAGNVSCLGLKYGISFLIGSGYKTLRSTHLSENYRSTPPPPPRGTTGKVSDLVGFIMSYCGLCVFHNSSFGLLASFCVLAGTRNLTIDLNNILEQNNCLFFQHQNDVAVSYLAFCGIQTI